ARCPMVWCWGRPAVILPEGFEDLEVDWDAVMAHELAHLRRRDHLWALMAEMLLCAMPWNPLSWAVRRCLGGVAGMAGGDWAVASATSAPSYADSLLVFAPVPRRAFAPAIVTRGGLSHRVSRILEGRGRRASRGLVIGAAVVASLGVSLAALARPRTARSV